MATCPSRRCATGTCGASSRVSIEFEPDGDRTRVKVGLTGRTKGLVPEFTIKGADAGPAGRDDRARSASESRSGSGSPMARRRNPGRTHPARRSARRRRSRRTLVWPVHHAGELAVEPRAARRRPGSASSSGTTGVTVLSDAPDDPSAYTLDHVIDDLARVHRLGRAGRAGRRRRSLLRWPRFPASRDRASPSWCVPCCSSTPVPASRTRRRRRKWQAMVERTASFAETKGLRAFVESKASATAVGL